MRVVRFYVSLARLLLLRRLLRLLLRLLLRWCVVSVACRTSTAILRGQCGVPDLTAILRDQCGVPDLNRDSVRPVWRAGPQPRSCEFSVACRTCSAIMWVQCRVPDLNRDHVSSVWRAGPQPRNGQKEECQKDCQKICQKELRLSDA